MDSTTPPTNLPQSALDFIEIEFLVAATGGVAVRTNATRFCGVSIDGRNVPSGGIWFAIQGERFDGHQFAEQAVKSGAAALVVARGRAEGLQLPSAEITIVEVDDTVAALGRLGSAYRQRFPSLKVAGIAGSNGKTTTKEMVAAILAAHAGSAAVHKTEGNFNNHLGLPLTLCKLNSSHRFAVLEMGMSALGELAHLVTLGRPDVGVVVSIGAEHLLTLGTVENVARAEGEIYGGLPPHGVAVYPQDEGRISPYAEASPAVRKIRFGNAPEAQVRILHARALLDGTEIALRLPDGSLVETKLAIVGIHNASNAAAAAAVAYALGVPAEAIARGLPDARTAKHRSSLVELGGRHVIDDCYNASPPSVMAALDTLADFARQSGTQSVAVLGDMLELGDTEVDLHRQIGARTAKLDIGLLVAVGRLAVHIAEGARAAGMPDDRVIHVDEVDDAAWHASKRAKPGDWILVKASRGARLERIFDQLRDAFVPPPPKPRRPTYGMLATSGKPGAPPPRAARAPAGGHAATQQRPGFSRGPSKGPSGAGPIVTYKRPSSSPSQSPSSSGPPRPGYPPKKPRY